MLNKLSEAWAKTELTFAACLGGLITALILLNVVTRSIGAALFWVDELAIYTMIWMTFLSTSAALHYGHSVSITIVTDLLPTALRPLAAKLVDLIIFGFALLMVWLCWRWFLPLDLIKSGFDLELFQSKTFNFTYVEPTNTLGFPKYIAWLVVCLFTMGALLHSTANLLGPYKGEAIE